MEENNITVADVMNHPQFRPTLHKVMENLVMEISSRPSKLRNIWVSLASKGISDEDVIKEEYFDILDKKSNLPRSERDAIKGLVEGVINKVYNLMLSENGKEIENQGSNQE